MNQITTEIMSQMKKSFELTQLKDYCKTNYFGAVKKFLQSHEGNLRNMDELSLLHVKEFLANLLHVKKLKIGTVNNYRSALKYLFEIVLEKKWCDKQVPFLKGYKTLPTVLSKESVMSVVNSAENILYSALFLTVYASGIRIDEALNLRISDIDTSMMQIHIRKSKNGSARKAILSEKNLIFLRKYFKEWWLKKFGQFEREDYLFCLMKKNARLSYVTALKAFSRAVHKAGVAPTATIHSLRHSFAVYLLEKGTSLGTIKELLGHRSLRSTLIYTRLASYSKMGVKSPLDYEDSTEVSEKNMEEAPNK